jgi:hypothetical protein
MYFSKKINNNLCKVGVNVLKFESWIEIKVSFIPQNFKVERVQVI